MQHEGQRIRASVMYRCNSTHSTCSGGKPHNKTQHILRIRMSFIARCLHIPGICFVTEATAVQQNDSDRIKNTDNKNKN